jgi:ABC-type polysaccharide/polyol phosphate transport system ATPase subunit
MSDIVIRAEGLSKKYRLGVINRRQLVDQIESWVARKMGRSDPHASIFEHATDRMPTPYDFWALKDISFEIKRGDVVGVMGRNGSGKSTLLKLLSRITAPTDGRAYLKGRLASLLEVGTGFNYDLTGRENVYLNGSILGLKKREIDNRYTSIVEFAEIQDFMDTPVKRYSSGMRVRLAFAVAAHLEPDILILDEVLAVGDAKFQEKCLNRIKEIKDSGVTVLFVSHSAQSVLQLCSKGILLAEGKIIEVGTARETTQTYLESMHLQINESMIHDIPETRVGQLAGRAAQAILKSLKGGHLVFNIAVETPNGIIIIDVGWISESRFKTIRTEPSWSAAPDLCVSIVSISKSDHQVDNDIHHLLNTGAQEAWALLGDGSIVRHKKQHSCFLVDSICQDYLKVRG